MSTSRPQGINRETAEHLLDGTGGMDSGQLARILAAAAAPGYDTELAGEETAVTAFQAHLLTPASTSRRGQMIKTPLARLLTAKVLTAAAALATGGAALAASTGALTGHSPAPVHPGASQYPGTVQTSPATQLATAPGQTTTGSPSPGSTIRGGTPALCRDLASRAGVPVTASPAALTQALASPVMSQALRNPAFAGLTATTGEAAAVPDYCALELALPRLPQPALAGELPPAVLAGALTSLAPPALATVLTSLPPTPLAQALTTLRGPALATVLTTLPDPALATVLTTLRGPALATVLTTLPGPALATVLTTLAPGPLTQVLTGLRPTMQSRILGELPTSALRQLAPSALAKLPSSVLATLPASVLAKLPPSVLATLPASVLGNLPPSVLATLPTSVLATLPPSIRAELPASVLAQLPVG
jgi:hypothetical protein